MSLVSSWSRSTDEANTRHANAAHKSTLTLIRSHIESNDDDALMIDDDGIYCTLYTDDSQDETQIPTQLFSINVNSIKSNWCNSTRRVSKTFLFCHEI